MGIVKLWRMASEKPAQEQEKTFKIEFQFRGSVTPFSLSVTHISGGHYYGDMIRISADGAHHPFNPYSSSGLIGDVNKNPALMPALELAKRNFLVIAKAGMIAAGLDGRAMDVHDGLRRNGEPQITDHGDGIYCLLRFNPKDYSQPHPSHKPAKPRQIERLYGEVVTGLKAMESKTKKLVAKNQHRNPNADPVAKLRHESELNLHRLRTMMGAGVTAVASDDLDFDAMVKVAGRQGLQGIQIARTDISGRITGLIRAAFHRRFG